MKYIFALTLTVILTGCPSNKSNAASEKVTYNVKCYNRTGDLVVDVIAYSEPYGWQDKNSMTWTDVNGNDAEAYGMSCVSLPTIREKGIHIND